MVCDEDTVMDPKWLRLEIKTNIDKRDRVYKLF